jgi:hypothetical protein
MSAVHYQNVVTLLEQYVSLQNKIKVLEKQLQMQGQVVMDNIDYIEKLEEELEHNHSYSKTLIDQATVIINENNIMNVPSIEELSKKLLVL